MPRALRKMIAHHQHMGLATFADSGQATWKPTHARRKLEDYET